MRRPVVLLAFVFWGCGSSTPNNADGGTPVDSDAGADAGDAGSVSFACGAMNCQAPAQYCVGTEGPGTAPVRYTGCSPTPASCTTNYTCACFQAAGKSETSCSLAAGGITTLEGLP
jgi:hypothetical protein